MRFDSECLASCEIIYINPTTVTVGSLGNREGNPYNGGRVRRMMHGHGCSVLCEAHPCAAAAAIVDDRHRERMQRCDTELRRPLPYPCLDTEAGACG